MRTITGILETSVLAGPWKHGRVVLVAGFHYFVEEPRRFLGDRKSCRSIARYLLRGEILQELPRRKRIFKEFFWRRLICEFVIEPMRRNLMTQIRRTLDEMRISLCYVAQEKAGCLHPSLGKYVEQSVKVPLNSAWQPVPAIALWRGIEVENMEPFLDVYRQ
jgi:hypothetical protein